ncbi:MAG TPA: bifunctional UDP-sugar hydrolase/5'-nucleotidase [Bryobacteraceae bacterium]|jgi:2',3'-cyclic-nucleotide 2'-phosphodiesterase (5'-nucleotidase family)|nr:bifunctional UDP-sugar hydrolase/5'-nucleotidase [Bryobacteraceae bacterium]
MKRPTQRWVVLGLLVTAPLCAEIRSLTILHTNDLHARLTPLDNHQGGFAYVAAAIQRERAHCTDCILLNAGDLVQGSPVSTIYHGLPVFEISNFFHFDAATLGNHEFDYGWPQVRKFIQVANYPVVSANMVDAGGKLFTSQPYVILKVNGLRVAVIGAMTDDLINLTTPQTMGEWHAAPVFTAVRKYAAEVRNRSDLIVLLAHIGREEELKFLNEVPEIPVLVTGHLHTGLKQADSRDGRILVRVKGYGEEIGRLELKVDTEKKAPVSWTWKRIPVNAQELQPVAEVATQVQHWEDDVKQRVDQPLALAKRSFTKAQVRDLMERAVRDQTGADFAFINLGAVRDTLPTGQLLVRHIWDIMPFDNRVVFGKFKGRDLPAVVVGERQVEPDHEYTLAVSDFTAANQGAQEQLRSKGLVFAGDGGLLRDVLVDWFRKKKVIE